MSLDYKRAIGFLTVSAIIACVAFRVSPNIAWPLRLAGTTILIWAVGSLLDAQRNKAVTSAVDNGRRNTNAKD